MVQRYLQYLHTIYITVLWFWGLILVGIPAPVRWYGRWPRVIYLDVAEVG